MVGADGDEARENEALRRGGGARRFQAGDPLEQAV
jgi:hypothetical protein